MKIKKMTRYLIDDTTEFAVKIDNENQKFLIKKQGVDPKDAVESKPTFTYMNHAIMHGKEVTEKEYNEY